MADFRRWFYAFAVVALLAGLSIPAAAQAPFVCNTNAATPTVVRAEGYAELVGDLTLACTGGTPTSGGLTVPQVQIQIILNTNITSKLTGNPFNEALLIIDEPNAPGPNSNRPILNCGNTGAPDTSISGPGVCSITSNGNPQQTYDGTPNTFATFVGGVLTAATCGTSITGASPAVPAAGTYGCGRPNVFQGRTGTQQNPNQSNIVVFSGVPLDPPGTGTSRTLRITNVRADAEFLGIASTFTQTQIQMNITIQGTQTLQINNPQQIVALVQRGLIMGTSASGAGSQRTRLDFVQCNTENGRLFTAAANFAFGATPGGGSQGGGFNAGGGNANTNTPTVRFIEGFNTAFKPKNIAHTLANGSLAAPGGGYVYNGGLNYPTDLNQNVPGAIYNTESGFEFFSNSANPPVNPPQGIGTTVVTGAPPAALNSTGQNAGFNTGISGAGVASQGTRLALNFSNIPQGSNIYVPPVVFLYRQGTTYCNTTTVLVTVYCSGTGPGAATGVMVLTSTDANGAGAFTPVTTTTNLQQVAVTGGAGLAVYEVLFSDPSSLEQVDVPVVVAFVANLAANAPAGLPVTGVTAQVAGGFAPFYNPSNTVRSPSSTLPVPRFIPGATPLNLFLISKCACDLLFPFASSSGGFDTGLAIANTSLDPGAAFGFVSTGPQQGSVTFFYYGTGANNAAPPAAQTSAIVPAGQVLTYVLSTGGGSIGAAANGLDNRAAGFQGYIIVQTSFQYCHGFAFIGALGGGATSSGISEGYLGIVLDNGINGILPRTLQAAENQGH